MLITHHNENKILNRLFEWLVLIFIIIAPSHNSLGDINLFGYSIVVINIALICSLGLLIAIKRLPIKGKKSYFTGTFFAVFIFELLVGGLRGQVFEIGTILCILLFVIWFNIDPQCFTLKKVYIAFYISTIIAAIFSASNGLADSGIIRAATKVDGSIAVICFSIVLFADHSKMQTMWYSIFKNLSIGAAFLVLGFGMSRSRIILVAALFIVWLAKRFWDIITSKHRVTLGQVMSGPVLIVGIIVALNLPIVQALMEQSMSRFESGLLSVGRTEEIDIGINMFKENVLLGYGWSEFEYIDYLNYRTSYFGHCMYVAIIARGGVLLGFTFALSLFSILKDVLKQKYNFLAIVLFTVFLALGYGNAGLFNYTISSSLCLLSLLLKSERTENIKLKQGETHENTILASP